MDIGGLAGYQFLSKTTNSNGTVEIKRVVAVDIYVGVSAGGNTQHFQSTDIPKIKAGLEAQYNKGFRDGAGNTVEFQFNMKAFDVKSMSAEDAAKYLRRTPGNIATEPSKGGVYPLTKGMTLSKEGMTEQGQTQRNKSVISTTADDPNHTISHEVAHNFLDYNLPLNPQTPEQHSEAGGVFTCSTLDINGNSIISTQPVNQANIDLILKVLPTTTGSLPPSNLPSNVTVPVTPETGKVPPGTNDESQKK